MIDGDGIAGGPERILALGDGLVDWVAALGLDPILVHVAAAHAAHAELRQSGLPLGDADRGGSAFLAGFFTAAVALEGLHVRVDDTTAALASAFRLVARRGRHAVIADWCDLDGVARLEQRVAEVLDPGEGGLGSPLRRLLARLFESGLASGFAALGSET